MASRLTPHPGDPGEPTGTPPGEDLLDQLAQLDPQRDTEPTEEQWARSRAHLQHLMASPATTAAITAASPTSTSTASSPAASTDPQQTTPTTRPTHTQETARMSTPMSIQTSPRTNHSTGTRPHPAPASRGRRRVVLGLAAAAAAATITGVGVALPSASSIAYAGSWSAVPTEVGAAAGLAQATECAATWQQKPAGGITAADVLVSERRKTSWLTVVRKDDGAVVCTSIDGDTTGWEALAPTRAMGADEVSVESQGSQGDFVTRSSIAGQVGAEVTGIEVLAGSKTVTASLGGGRWAAWWPGGEGGEVDEVQVVIHTAAGERTVLSSDLFG